MRLFCSLLLALQAPTTPPDTAHIVIVATTDVHGRVLGWDYVRDAATPGGLSRAATALETLRARYPANLVLVDAGDLLQGNPFATYFGRYDKRQPQPRRPTATSRRTSSTTAGRRCSRPRWCCHGVP